MHNYLIKIMIFLGVIAMICSNAALTPNIMHAATISSSGNAAAVPVDTSISLLSNTASQTSPVPMGLVPSSQGKAVNLLSLTQPLGSLVDIRWNDLETSENGSIFSLILSDENDQWIQAEANRQAPAVVENQADDYTFVFSTDLVGVVFHNETHQETSIACTACHNSPNIGALTEITHIDETLFDQQISPASIVKCNACHMQEPQFNPWQIRGVE